MMDASATNMADIWAGLRPTEERMWISRLRSNIELSIVTTTLRTTMAHGTIRGSPFPSK